MKQIENTTDVHIPFEFGCFVQFASHPPHDQVLVLDVILIAGLPLCLRCTPRTADRTNEGIEAGTCY